MIAQNYIGGSSNLDITIFKSDIHILIWGEAIECLTIGDKEQGLMVNEKNLKDDYTPSNLLVRLKLSPNNRYGLIRKLSISEPAFSLLFLTRQRGLPKRIQKLLKENSEREETIIGYSLEVHPELLDKYVRTFTSNEPGPELMGWRGIQFDVPFDRIHIVYENVNGIKFEKKFDPLAYSKKARNALTTIKEVYPELF